MDDAIDPTPSLPAKFGRYHVVAAIQGGAMGRLYLAQDPEIDRMVVVKALAPDCGQDQKTRFLREARAAGRLSHPNVVSIFDVGEQDKTPFIVMEYIEGETLAQVIKHREPILFSRRLEIIDQLCAGLAYAHDLGVVHRDIKPSNLMLDKTGKLRILDFGIARLDTSDATQTSTGIIGTLNYMSPEQWEGGVIEGRSDMFSVGAVMYELFSFQKAFPGNTPPEVLRYMFGEGPRPFQEVCPLAPPELTEVVVRMLARNASDRYANLHEVRAAITGLRAQVQDVEHFDDKTAPMGAGGPSGAWPAPPPTRGGATAQGFGPGTGIPTRPTSPTGWPVRSGSTMTQAQPAVNTGATEVTALQAGTPDRGRTIRLVSFGAGGVVVIGIAAWLAMGGLNRETPGPGANPAPAAPPTASGSTPPAVPPSTSETPAPPAGGRATGDTGTGAATRGTASNAGRSSADSTRGATRGTPTPPPAPAGPVDLVVSWSQPFHVSQGGKNLTETARARQDLKAVRPELGELYAESPTLRLHFPIPTDRSRSIQVPAPGFLAVTLTTQFKACTVVVDSRDFVTGNIPIDRPKPIAAGKHQFSLRCGDKDSGRTEFTQTKEVTSGFDVTVVSFPPGAGG